MKITGYTALTSAAANDELVIVDVSDTTMAASGTTKNITTANLLAGASGAGAPVFNVKAAPYNATGNGTTDDTTAVQAAVTDRKSVV